MEKFQNITNSNYKSNVNQNLSNRFSQQSLGYLSWEIKFLFFDYMNLEKEFTNKHGYNDYSFLVAPAYKAFEGFLIQLGGDLKLFESQSLPQSPASFFEEKQVDNILKIATDGILDLGKEVDKDIFNDIKGRISEMRNLLKRYRHTPAHYQGNQCIPSISKANDYAASIIFNINDLIKMLLETKILKQEQMHGN